MAAFVATILGKLAVGGTAAAAAGGTAAAGAGIGSTIATILSGGATAFSIMQGFGAAREEATSLNLAAADAESEQADEGLLGLQRRNSLKAALQDAIAEREVAYAASGADVSFGTPTEARRASIEDANRALTIDTGTEMSRVARLQERADLFRARARSVKRGALMTGLVKGLSFAGGVANRG